MVAAYSAAAVAELDILGDSENERLPVLEGFLRVRNRVRKKLRIGKVRTKEKMSISINRVNEAYVCWRP